MPMTQRSDAPAEQADVLCALLKPLLVWYNANKRTLPWRSDPTPYHVWVSEIMLQQTRVEAVKPYYARFLKALPRIEDLAYAREEDLLKLWEGLGYYSRVRNMQKAARRIVEDFGGEFPTDKDSLQKLPGIGPYTAGAIASIAFAQPVPAVDGNVLRVLARIRADARPITDAGVKMLVEKELLACMPKEAAGDFNQALMELGALVCLPNAAPRCSACPLTALCQAYLQSVTAAYPVRETKKPRRIEEKTVLLLCDEKRVALRKRPEKGLLAGMYEFPSLSGFQSPDQVLLALKEWGIKSLRILPLDPARHIFTHIEWHMQGYLILVDELEKPVLSKESATWHFVERGALEKHYAIPSAFAAYTKALHLKTGKDAFEREDIS